MLYKRRFLTFIEIIIIITLLTITLGLIGVNIRDLVKQQRFKSEVSVIVDQLRLAQDLMLVLNTDVLMRFAKENNSIKYHLEVENVLPKGWQREINRPRRNLTTVAVIEFDDASAGLKNAGLPIELKFLSGGSVMSQGVLRLATQDGEMETYICLPGYPRPIVNVTDPKSDKGCDAKIDADFFDKLTFDTRREIEKEGAK